jgi:hypothetical protein
MKKLMMALLSLGFFVDLNGQTQSVKASALTLAINKKIDQAIQHWKQDVTSEYPDIKAIIQDEIAAAIKAQSEKKKESEVTVAINKKIDQAIQLWKRDVTSEYPNIEAIIKGEIMAFINREIGINRMNSLIDNSKSKK